MTNDKNTYFKVGEIYKFTGTFDRYGHFDECNSSTLLLTNVFSNGYFF